MAGVLLGKTSFNSLYGLQGGLPQPSARCWRPDSARMNGSRPRRMYKIVVFLEFNARSRPPAGLAWWRGNRGYAKRVGRPPRPVETASRNHGGAGQRTGAIGQDRGVDRRQHG